VTPPDARTVANIHMSFISPETRVYGEHPCGYQYESIFVRFHIVVSESQAEKFSETNDKTDFT